MPHLPYRLLGVLLIAPWLLIPRPAPAPRMTGVDSTSVRASADIQTPPRSIAPKLDDWRRTPRGWERRSTWLHEKPRRHPTRLHRIHPLTVAWMQVFLCVGALIACRVGSRRADM